MPHPAMDQANKTPVHLPGTPQNNSATQRSHFTPCRRLGLKRKSTNTPDAHGVVAHTPNSSFKNHNLSFETPKRVIAFPDSTPDSSPMPVHELKKGVDTEPTEPLQNKECGDDAPKKVFLRKRRTPNFAQEVPSQEKISALKKTIEEKERRLAGLNADLQERNKEVDADLAERTETWRRGCQQALYRLHEKTKSLGTEVTMTEMIKRLGIPFHVVHYDPDLEDFQD